MPTSRLLARLTDSRRWTVDDARAVVAAYVASGLSARAFSLREGIDPQRLRRWNRAIGESPRSAETPTFVEVPRERADIVEIVLRNGRVVRVAESVDVAALARIADALDGGVAC